MFVSVMSIVQVEAERLQPFECLLGADYIKANVYLLLYSQCISMIFKIMLKQMDFKALIQAM